MAAGKEIRLRLRIDDDGLPLDLKRITGVIGKTFDDAASRMVGAFEKAAADITKTISRIASTPIVDTAMAQAHLSALNQQLTQVQRAAIAAGRVQPLAAAGSPPRNPPIITTPAAASPGPRGPNNTNVPPRLPASVRLANRANAVASQNATAVNIIAGITNASAGSAGVSRLSSLFGSLTAAAGGAGKAIGIIPPALGRVALGFAGLGGAIYTIRSIGRAIDASFVQPLEAVAAKFIEVTEESRKFELAIGGVTGAQRARQLNYGLVSASRNLPASVESLRETGRTFAALPALAGNLNDSDALQQVIGLNKTVSRLATLDPVQGTGGATTALRELLEGGGGGDSFNSLRRRFGLSASALAHALNKSVDDLKADPALGLRAVQKISEILIPDSALNGASTLFSVKVQKVRDAIGQALVRVGDEGAFDALVSRVGNIADKIFAGLDGPQFAARARKVSDAIDRAMGSISSSVERFLRGVTGASADTPLFDVVTDAIAAGIDRLSKVLENLPAVAAGIGQSIGVVVDHVGRLTDALVDIADAARHPEKVAGRLGDYATLRAGGYLMNTDLNRLSDQAGDGLVGLLNKIGKESPAASLPAPIAQAVAPHRDDQFGAIGALVRKLDSASPWPNFGATLLQTNAAYGRLDDLTRDQVDRISQVNTAGNGAFTASDGMLDRLQSQMLKAVDEIDNALSDAARRLKEATDPAEITQLRGMIDSVNATREKLTAAFGQAGQLAADGLTEAARDFRRGLADELASLPLAGSAALRTANGRNARVDAAMAKLGELGIVGGSTTLQSWTIQQRQGFWSRMSERGLDDIASQARTGAISVGMTAEQLDQAAGNRPGDRVIQQRQADLISNRLLPAQGGILADANARLAANPNDPLAIRDAAKATEQYAKLTAELYDLKDAIGGLGPAFREFAASARSSLENGLGDVFYQLSTGANSLRETLHSIADQILRDFMQMQAHNLMQAFVGDAGRPQQSGQAGGWGGVIGAVLGAFTGGGGAAAQLGAQAGAAIAAADGGVFPGGFQAFAAGGVARRPMLGLIGEGKHPEAIVPMPNGHVPIGMTRSGEFFASLPGGRRISAQMQGGMRAFANGGIWEGRSPSHVSADGGMFAPPEREFTPTQAENRIFVVNDFNEALRHGLNRHKDAVVSIVGNDYANRGRLSKVIR